MTVKQKIIVTLVLTIAIITRFIYLDHSPPHLSNDEISIAYDAYSISKTLRDEHNHFLPLSFESHGTYKAPLSIYLTIPTTIMLGNNEYAARLPSAIFGILTIIVLGLLVYKLSKNLSLSIMTGLILTISPWHIYSSRMILESNIALFFTVSGIYFFFYGLQSKKLKHTLLSSFSFSLSIWAYHTQWGFIPIIMFILFFLNQKKVLKQFKHYLIALILFSVLVTPIFFDFFHNIGTTARANTEIITKEINLERQLKDDNNSNIKKTFIILNAVLGNYSSYLNPGRVFFNGLNLLPQDNPYQIGLFLAPFLPAFIIGFFYIKKYFTHNSNFIFTWTFLSPIIPSLTQGGPNFVRDLICVAPYSIIISSGIMAILTFYKKNITVIISFIFLVILSFFYFCITYFYHFPQASGEGFQYGYKQIAEYVNQHSSKYQRIIIDYRFGKNNAYIGVPHLYIPYFIELNPLYLQNRQHSSFDKYETKTINWHQEKIQKEHLYIVPVSNLPPAYISEQLEQLLEIQLPNFQPAFNIYKGK